MASTPGAPTSTGMNDGVSTPGGGIAERAGREYMQGNETKPGFMTSEFISSMIAALGILIAAALSDNFQADEAWPYIAFLSIGYMISRGLAKSGIGRRGDR